MMRHPASYRDPAGFVFKAAGSECYRAVMPGYAAHYEWAQDSGFFKDLMAAGKLLPFVEIPENTLCPEAWRVLQPSLVSRWTYPAEWSFEQLRDAALLTLDLTHEALQRGGILKDASAQNIQFVGGRPVLIDTLSVEKHTEGAPWKAFRQFCSEFLYPLLLAHYLPCFRLAELAAFPRGFTALQTAERLPAKARWNFSNQLYVFLPASLERKAASTGGISGKSVSKSAIFRNLEHLQKRIPLLQPAYARTNWSHYYEETILSAEYLAAKEAIISQWLSETTPASVLDLGCNTGIFSMLAAQNPQCSVTATDADSACIDALYQKSKKGKFKNLQCLVTDLTHPLAGGGWQGAEWDSWAQRMAGHQSVFALALVHHLALAFNIPLSQIADLLHQLATRWAVVEWIPKTDPKAALLLQHRDDIFGDYNEDFFRKSLTPFFRVLRVEAIAGSDRSLYFLERRER